MALTEEDLKLIGGDVGGHFSHEEGDKLIFGSNTFPSYRIEADKAEAEEAIARYRKPDQEGEKP
jgi:hypothetical protein